MIRLNINHTRITASNLGTLVEGNINSIFLQFTFSAEWDGLSRIAVFVNGDVKVSVYLSSDTCAIPWEVLTEPGELFLSLRGMGNDGNYIICTENTFLGRIGNSYANTEYVDAREVTPDVIDALMAAVEASKGMSAYEVAVDSGFEGAEADWLASLKGEPGITVIDPSYDDTLLNEALSAKLDIAQGSENSDKFVKTDADGNIIFVSLATLEGGSY